MLVLLLLSFFGAHDVHGGGAGPLEVSDFGEWLSGLERFCAREFAFLLESQSGNSS